MMMTIDVAVEQKIWQKRLGVRLNLVNKPKSKTIKNTLIYGVKTYFFIEGRIENQKLDRHECYPSEVP